MADEQKTEQEDISTQNTDSKKVEMSQEDLNNLINSKFAKGAEKAQKELLESLGVQDVDSLKAILQQQKEQEEAQKSEFEKMQERLNALETEKEQLSNTLASSQKKAKLNELALKNGIEDIDYLEFKYDRARTSEDFNENDFIKSFIDNGTGLKQAPKIDNTPTKQDLNPNDFKTNVSNITSLKDLERLQNNL